MDAVMHVVVVETRRFYKRYKDNLTYGCLPSPIDSNTFLRILRSLMKKREKLCAFSLRK